MSLVEAALDMQAIQALKLEHACTPYYRRKTGESYGVGFRSMCSSSPPFVPRTSVNLSAFSHRINEEAFLLFIPTKGLSSVTHRIMNMTDVTQILVALSAGQPREKKPRVPREKRSSTPASSRSTSQANIVSTRSLFISSQPHTTSSPQRSVKHFYLSPSEGVDDVARQSTRDFVC
jgi:hypothetical protein